MKDTAIYTELETMALPLIESYHKDLLIIDRDSINEAPTTPFIHSTGRYGTILTHLIPAIEYPMKSEQVNILFGKGGRDQILKNIISSIGYIKRSDKKDLVLYFDGVSLHRISPEHALDIASTYELDIKHQWMTGEVDKQQFIQSHFEWIMEMNNCKNLQVFKSSIQCCYTMGLNPLSKLRDWYGVVGVEYCKDESLKGSFDFDNDLHIIVYDKGSRIEVYLDGNVISF